MSAESAIQLLLVDDHPLYRAGVVAVLESQRAGLRVHCAADAESGLVLLGRHADIAIVLMDLRLPGVDGLAALRLYAQAFPLVARLLISGQDVDAATVQRALDAGASGFIPKTLTAVDMIAAIYRVLGGGVYLPPSQATLAAGPEGLSLRQLEVLSLMLRGKANKEIARELGIVERTVKAHITGIFEALNVSSRVQAVMAAQRLGLGPGAGFGQHGTLM